MIKNFFVGLTTIALVLGTLIGFGWVCNHFFGKDGFFLFFASIVLALPLFHVTVAIGEKVREKLGF